MNEEPNYKNNPLHGLSLKNLLTEIVDHYGFEILFAYLNINCFKSNPSIESSIKFLKKTDWAREKVEAFYLYQYKSLPRASAEQFELPPRDRIIPDGQLPGEPAELSLEDAERLREKRAKKTAEHGRSGQRTDRGQRFDKGERARPYAKNRDSKTSRTEKASPWGADKNASRPAGKQQRFSTERSLKPSSKTVETDGSDPWSKWKK